MAKDIVMPKMGYDMTEGKLLRWIKHEGDTITKGEAVAEIETDKVNIEVEAFDSGVLQRILVQEGETVPVGERIATLAAPGEPPPSEEQPARGATAPTAAAPTAPQPIEEQPGAAGGTIKQEPPSTARAGASGRLRAQASAAP